MTKPPTVPPQNRSPKGIGDAKSGSLRDSRANAGQRGNPHEQGQQANTEQNATHQGDQQDR
jgi:hypothetical protein